MCSSMEEFVTFAAWGEKLGLFCILIVEIQMKNISEFWSGLHSHGCELW